jgi:ArsR family transcriptional regulator
MTVGEIVSVLDQSQPRVSRHLKLLCDAGLLSRVKEGTLVFYRKAEEGLGADLGDALVKLVNRGNEDYRKDREAAEYIRQERFSAAQAYFSRNAESWNEIRSLYVPEDQVEEAFIRLANPRDDLTVLDVGTGTGRMLELFSPYAKNGLGVDVSRDMLAVARSNLAQIPKQNCQVQLGDMYDLPVDANSQDLILFHQVLHYAEEPSRAISEAAKATKSGGKILIADFETHDLEALREQHAHRRLGFSDEQITRWAARSGLHLADTERLSGGDLTVIIWKLEKEASATTSAPSIKG